MLRPWFAARLLESCELDCALVEAWPAVENRPIAAQGSMVVVAAVVVGVVSDLCYQENFLCCGSWVTGILQ